VTEQDPAAIRQRIAAALDASIDRCARCKVCDVQIEAVMTTLATAGFMHFTDQEPLPSGLIPAERLALTVARRQLERGDNPPLNITTALVMTIDRLLEEMRTARAAQSPERTVTHWGVRVPGEPAVREYDDEEDAREHLLAGEVLVSCRVTVTPWTEAPETAREE